MSIFVDVSVNITSCNPQIVNLRKHTTFQPVILNSSITLPALYPLTGKDSFRMLPPGKRGSYQMFEIIKIGLPLSIMGTVFAQGLMLAPGQQLAFSLDNLLKDVRFILKEAAKRQRPLPVTEGVLHLLEKASREGLGNQDVSAIYLALSHLK